MVGRGCWPRHRYPEAEQAGAPLWPMRSPVAACTCRRTIAQHGVASRTGGCRCCLGGVRPEFRAGGLQGLSAQLLLLRQKQFVGSIQKGRKQNLPSVWLKIISKNQLVYSWGQGVCLVPDHCLLKWCQAASEESGRPAG